MLTIYFSNEHDDFGNSINEIIDRYRDYSISSIEDAKLEISSLLEIEDEEALSSIMKKIANDRFHPEPWGETWRSFLEKILFLLKH
ncbi:contact-dependent growth inhibition system immunity protein [Klebsiella sp. 141153]|nr:MULTISPECIES: contact-dependent growth inhibition system immunity protein [Klebsiella]MDT8883735.1 contact-dependent growth inhibition system immunity protein [Klebsiella aerogenes]MDU9357363.1 contact-dependent growth inhibition system immunity protein [Klebsiella sp. 141153]